MGLTPIWMPNKSKSSFTGNNAPLSTSLKKDVNIHIKKGKDLIFIQRVGAYTLRDAQKVFD